MKHWGPLDGAWRRADEHGFPADRRDGAWHDGKLTDEAVAAMAASRRYIEIVTSDAAPAPAIAEFLNVVIRP